MGLFEKIFGKGEPKAQINSYFQTLDGYTPVFTTWNGGVYESELCQAAIESSARHASKLNVDIRGAAQPVLTSRLKHSPCSWMTWSQFMARVMTILDADNTCFIVPVRSDTRYLETIGIYPIKPDWWELVETKDGTPYVRFHFRNGQAASECLYSIGIMTRHQYASDYFGEINTALSPTLDLINMQNQGIKEGIRAGASFRFMATYAQTINEEDIKEEQNRFNETFLKAGNGGGLLLFNGGFKDVKQIDSKPYAINANEMNAIRTNVFDYFNTNEKIIQNSGSDEDLDTFYNGKIEPFSIQLSEVLTKMVYTFNEIAFGNEIIVAANRLQYMSVAHKVSMAKELGDRGAITINEIRQLFNLIPLPDEIGNKIPARGEYYDFAIGKEGDNNGKTDSE